MEELVKTLSVLNKGVKRISKAYACEHILHCSPATFDNYVRAGIIPKGKKEIGFNELSGVLKILMVLNFKEYIKNKYKFLLVTVY